METKWTPGPWSLKIRSGTGESTANEVIAEIEQAEPEGGYRGDIARLQSAKHIGGIADEELVANAHLLFAAPDMYAALLVAELASEELCQGQDPANECWVTLATIRAALAKARGEAE